VWNTTSNNSFCFFLTWFKNPSLCETTTEGGMVAQRGIFEMGGLYWFITGVAQQ
jgi:hypothetical protein